MKHTRKRTYLFREMKIVDELQDNAIKEPTKENIRHYEKMQDLFFKHVKNYARGLQILKWIM